MKKADSLLLKKREKWRKETMKLFSSEDNIDCKMRIVAKARDLLIPRQFKKAFNEFLVTSGAGDHPEFILRLYHIGLLMRGDI